MYIDTHCHLNFKAFESDWQEVVEESLREHVEMIIVGTDRATSEKAIEIASKYSGVWATVGFHPIHVDRRDWRSEVQYIRALATEKKVVAIGEVGLDYYRMPNKTPSNTPDVGGDTADVKKIKQDQETIFQFFLDIAVEIQKPLMLHCREAEEEFLAILSAWQNSKSKARNSKQMQNSNTQISKRLESDLGIRHSDFSVRGQWHCFGGTLDQAQKALELGLKIGFTGLITYNNQWDEVIRKLPLDRLMTETDAPYLTPMPYRGQRNEPRYVKEVIKKIAELKNISIEKVEGRTYLNAQSLYKIE